MEFYKNMDAFIFWKETILKCIFEKYFPDIFLLKRCFWNFIKMMGCKLKVIGCRKFLL